MSEKIIKLKTYLEALGVIFVGFSALCFITGYLVIAVYQNVYRTVPAPILQPSYIATGAWAISILFLPVLIYSAVLMILYVLIKPVRKYLQELLPFLAAIDPEMHPVLKTYYRIYAGGFFVIVITILSMFAVFMTASGLMFNQAWISPLVNGLVFTAALLFLASSISASIYRPSVRWFSVGSAALCAVILTLVFIFHTLSFGRSLYFTIPPQLGGGAPIPVKILIQNDPELKSYLRGNGVTFVEEVKDGKPQESNVSNYLILLFSTEKDYVFALPLNGAVVKSFSISREQIKTVEYNANLSAGYAYK
jgi:hypothetical protein